MLLAAAFVALQSIAVSTPAQNLGRVYFTMTATSASLKQLQIQAVARATTSTSKLVLYTTDGQAHVYTVISCNIYFTGQSSNTVFVVQSTVNRTYKAQWDAFTAYQQGWKVSLSNSMTAVQ